jgi:hypothetical protein
MALYHAGASEPYLCPPTVQHHGHSRDGSSEIRFVRPAAFTGPLRRHAMHQTASAACRAIAGHVRTPTSLAPAPAFARTATATLLYSSIATTNPGTPRYGRYRPRGWRVLRSARSGVPAHRSVDARHTTRRFLAHSVGLERRVTRGPVVRVERVSGCARRRSSWSPFIRAYVGTLHQDWRRS